MGKIIAIIVGLLFIIESSECNYTDEYANFFQLLQSYGFKDSYEIPRKTLPTKSQYDFIVVGAGPAGAAVTNRLSENHNWNILLLEAGEPEGIVNQVPLAATAFQLTDYNWGYRVERDGKSCLGMNDQRCTWPRGKCLGGTSTLNNMIHTRGNKLDFDKWAEMGNYGWQFNEVLPYFKKSERFHIPGTLYTIIMYRTKIC